MAQCKLKVFKETSDARVYKALVGVLISPDIDYGVVNIFLIQVLNMVPFYV